MEIEIDAESFYKALTRSPKSSPQDQYFLEATKQLKDGETWKSSDSAIVTPHLKWDISGQNTQLPSPFNKATPYVYRDNNFYSISLCLPLNYFNEYLRQANQIITQIPGKMKEIFGNQWVPLDNLGRGIILAQKQPIIVLSEREISIGRGGTIKMKLGSLEEFTLDMINLGKVTGAYVNSAIDSAVEKGLVPTNPDYSALISF